MAGGGLSPALGRVGPYEILDLLGQGGMAAVYLARDRRPGAGAGEVAVKVLARMRPSWVQRFSREFDSARRVDHPNVVKVLEAGEADGLAYYSMERIHGVTAARYVLGIEHGAPLPAPPPMDRRGPARAADPIQLDRCLDVSIQLSRAVGAIHAVGLVHRDLKPGNVLVTPAGIVKLVDFGVAKWLEEQTSFTQVGHVVGSYSYMSPEQITGAEVDHRADMYGMGILLYELLTGAPPFRARRPQEYLWLHCTAQPDPVSRILEGIPPELDALLLRLLAKEPADRPETMAVVEAELIGLRAEIDGEAHGASLEIMLDTNADGGAVVELEPTSDEDVTVKANNRSIRDLARELEGESTTRLSPEEIDRLRKRVKEASMSDQPAIRMQETRPIRRAAVKRPRSSALAASNVALAALVTPRHVGRKKELEQLIQHLKAAKRFGVRAVLIEGEEGTGKTRLLHTFRGLSWVKGARVAIGRCHSAGGAFCAPFHDILLRLAGPGLARSHYDRVLGPDKDMLLRFFPALAREGEAAPPGVTDFGASPKDDLAALYRSAGAVFRRAAQDAPLVLGIEDVQWADEGTTRLVASLLRRLAAPNPAQVLLVLTYRGEDVAGSDTERALMIPAIGDMGNVHSISLNPLSGDETRELIESVTMDVPVEGAVIARLADAARGNPRFAVEVARTLVEAGGSAEGDWDLPTSLIAAYARRLDSLSKSARDIARVIALLGGRPPLTIVQRAAGLEGRKFELAVTELEHKRVIEVDHKSRQDTAALTSDVLRTAVLDSLSTNQARALHRRAAAAWLKTIGEGAGPAGHAARHLYAAAENRAAFPYALKAAFRASEARDYSTMRRWMAQIGDPGEALDEVSREAQYQYWMLRFATAFSDGDLARAEAAIEQAAEKAPDTRARLTTGVACARLHTRTGNYMGAVKVCRRGLREAREGGRPDQAVMFAIQGSRAARRSGDNESALAWLSEADMLLAVHPGYEPLQVRAAWTRSAVLLELRREEEAEGEIHRAIDLAIQTGQERPEAGLRTNLSVIYWRRGEVDLAIEEVDRAVRIFEETGERDQVALCESNLAELRLMQGRLPEALEYARSCWMTFRRLGDRQGTIISASVLLSVARVLQDPEEADKLMEAVGEPLPGQPLEGIWTLYWLERSRWHRTQEQKSVAWHCVEQAARALGTAAPPYRRREVALARAELLYDRGQYARAEPLADKVVRGAEDEMHWPVAWYARAVRSAARARLGSPDTPSEPPPKLIEHNFPLALATAWYLSEAAAARGDEARAALLREEGAELARSTGFVDWTNVFAR